MTAALETPMKKGLTRQVAEIIDPVPFWCTPGMYGLKTEKELMERTMAGPGRRIAMDRARAIIKLVRGHG
jgi:hypothetical protein